MSADNALEKVSSLNSIALLNTAGLYLFKSKVNLSELKIHKPTAAKRADKNKNTLKKTLLKVISGSNDKIQPNIVALEPVKNNATRITTDNIMKKIDSEECFSCRKERQQKVMQKSKLIKKKITDGQQLLNYDQEHQHLTLSATRAKEKAGIMPTIDESAHDIIGLKLRLR